MPLRDFFKPWRSTLRGLRIYFRLYGGLGALVSSPYAHLSILLGVAAASFSSIRFGEIGASVLPNILGFTIGAMAIVLSIATSEFFAFLSQEGEPQSFFMKLVANFLHYIIIQATTIIVCVFEKGTASNLLNFISAIMFVYSILSPVAIGIQLLQMARLYNAKAGIKYKNKDQTKP